MKDLEQASIRSVVIDALADAAVALRTRPVRTALSALGIALAVATVVLVTAIPASGNAALQQRLAALGSDVLVAQTTTTGGSAVQLPTDSVAMVRRIGPVTTAAAVANLNLPVLRTRFADRNRTAGITALAVNGDLLDAVHGHVASGRALDRKASRLSGVVLGATAARWLGITQLRAGSSIQISIGGQPFTVTGILAPMPLNPELEQSVLIGADSARSVLGWDGHPTVVYLRSIESQLNAVRAVLPRTLAPQLAGLIDVSRPSDVLAAKQLTNSAFGSLALALAAVALLVGGIGVSNTMVVAVLERRRELGVRRALGATRRDIAALILLEAVALALGGAIAGALLGVAGTGAWSLGHAWPVVIPPAVVLAGALIAAAVGCLAGLHPASRAVRISPTEALAA